MSLFPVAALLPVTWGDEIFRYISIDWCWDKFLLGTRNRWTVPFWHCRRRSTPHSLLPPPESSEDTWWHDTHITLMPALTCLCRDLACTQGVKLRVRTVKMMLPWAAMPHVIPSLSRSLSRWTIPYCDAVMLSLVDMSRQDWQTQCHDTTQAGRVTQPCVLHDVQSRILQL